jgi:hypothetical protein
LYYNLDVEKERSFETVLKENLPSPQKTGGEAITTAQELLFENLNKAIKKLKPEADEISSAKRAIRCFFAVINTEDLKQAYPTRESRRTLFYNWLFGEHSPDFPAYNYLATGNNWKDLFKELYDEEIFQIKDEIGVTKNVPSKQSAIPATQHDDSIGEKVSIPFNVYNIRAATK